MENYYSETKEHLKCYKFYVSSLENKKRQLIKLRGSNYPSGIANMATDYSKEKVSSSQTHDFTEEVVAEIVRLSFQINKLESLINDINEGIKNLDPLSKRIIEMKYINCFDRYYSWPSLAVHLNLEIDERQKKGEKIEFISEATCRRRASKAICKVAIQVYGVIKPVKKIS